MHQCTKCTHFKEFVSASSHIPSSKLYNGFLFHFKLVNYIKICREVLILDRISPMKWNVDRNVSIRYLKITELEMSIAISRIVTHVILCGRSKCKLWPCGLWDHALLGCLPTSIFSEERFESSHYVPRKCWELPELMHGITTQKVTIFTNV